jgi:hypothetical protein
MAEAWKTASRVDAMNSLFVIAYNRLRRRFRGRMLERATDHRRPDAQSQHCIRGHSMARDTDTIVAARDTDTIVAARDTTRS